MAGAAFELRLEAGEALDALGLALARMDKPRELFDAIGLALLASTDRRFETESAPDGTLWTQSIRALLDGGKTLTDTGHYRSTFAHEATDSGVAVGTNAIQAAILNFGGTIKAKNAKALAFNLGGLSFFAQSVTIPARPQLGLSDDDETEIIALAGEWLLEPLGGADEETRVDG